MLKDQEVEVNAGKLAENSPNMEINRETREIPVMVEQEAASKPEHDLEVTEEKTQPLSLSYYEYCSEEEEQEEEHEEEQKEGGFECNVFLCRYRYCCNK